MSKAKTVAKVVGSVVLSNARDVVEIPATMVVVEKDFNVRTQDDIAETKELAKTIKTEGLLSPVSVRKHADGKYFLVAGFRRFRAVTGPKEEGFLGRETITARIVEPSGDESKDALDDIFANLVENLVRKDITPYDLAVRCKFLRDHYGLKGPSIGNRLQYSDSQVNKLMQILDTDCKRMIARWKEECDPVSALKTKVLDIPTMTKWIAEANKHPEYSKDPKGYLNLMLDYALGIKKVPEDGDEPDPGDGPAPAPTNPKATVTQLTKALESAVESRKEATNNTDMARWDGIIEALKFALGQRKSCGSFRIEAKKPKAEPAAAAN